jgi:hypothetical protein
MKQPLINYTQQPRCDEFYTPDEAITPLLKYVNPTWRVWECTDPGASNITKLLKKQGNPVISTHTGRGQDFLTYKPEFEFDCIITNPPYSLKDQFLTRAYSLGKPFAFLLPVDSLASIKRVALFKEHGVQVLVFDRRINFMQSKKAVWFNTAWFCWQLLPAQLVFYQI